jgi:hypothetical protein
MEAFVALISLAGLIWLASFVGRNRQSRRRTVYRRNESYKRGPAWTDESVPPVAHLRPVPTPTGIAPRKNMADPRDQLIAVSKVSFQTVPLLNRSEARLLPLLESIVRSGKSGHRVMAQTALGEVIRPASGGVQKDVQDEAYASINSKRLDFAIIDRFGILKLAIEYQGHDHYRATSFMRDAVKREALRKAGVPMLEVTAEFQRDDVIRDVCRALGISQAAGGKQRDGDPQKRDSASPDSERPT